MNFAQNNLKNQSSPYLLQHANNPIHWQIWSENTLKEAQKQDKLLIISIGYTACHWCHVMEKEIFEKQEVAHLMNENFISIKVDREEHPDVDQFYMLALQIMTRQGGWPLNIIALPNGKPIWGATYLPQKQWLSALHQLKDLYQKDPAKMEEYAEKLEQGILSTQLIEEPKNTLFKKETLKEAVQKWSQNFDWTNGGDKGAPKFMMPNQLQYLLRYGFQENDKNVLNYVKLTLYKIAQGGINDAVGGGFSRYSVDDKWHIPHFEKMLYDNAQLASLYAKAYQVFNEDVFKETAKKTLRFIEKELGNPEDLFYASYDADSLNEKGEQEEGAYYIWNKALLQELLKKDFPLFSDLFNINHKGYWENGAYVLFKTENSKELLEKYNLTEEQLEQKEAHCLQILQQERLKRPLPILDHKCLTSWNALTISSFINYYQATTDEYYLNLALQSARAIWEKLYDKKLFKNYVNGEKQILGTLEDYAFLIKAFLELYQVTFEETWLTKAEELTGIAFAEFFNEEKNLFHLSPKDNTYLFTRLFEVHDNVIPSSNAVMCNNLFILGKLSEKETYSKLAKKMLHTYADSFKSTPANYSEWMNTYLNYTNPYYSLSFGDKCKDKKSYFLERYLPNVLLSPKMPIHLSQKDFRESDNSDYMFLCKEQACEKPTKKNIEVLHQILFK
ncbi:thioredoxin domain-containing protein [Mesonia sp. MT50]|uniref:Thioredoxin domain-containing protein n=1 Tax=Mesonia profundi TaxID=3070998 RepID=A0ABU1A069_9FLAO|nr:thioredoxin domain-containing protein [Mesonia profundi]MDQ7917024.1 thioredoxin domain-containing protein [Mesonia profundi]